MFKQILILAFVAVTIYACKNEVLVPADPATGGSSSGSGTGGTGSGGSTNTLVCFESDILPIFKSSCAKSGCHDVTTHKEGYIFDSYANIVRKDVRPGNATGSKVYQVLLANGGDNDDDDDDDDDDRMPLAPNPPLSATQIELIKKWINEGANNTTNCSTSCDLTIFNYSNAVRSILDANCIGCHNNGTSSGNVNLTTYTGVKAVASNGLLVKAITHSPGATPMPFGGAKMDDCKVSKITRWVEAGAPNN